MDLLVVRHAIAEEREAFAGTGQDDSQRPLTAEGRRKFEQGAIGLRRLVEAIEVLATSRLTRAVETGDLLARAYGVKAVVRLDELEPGAEPEALVRWLAKQEGEGPVAVVGHEPHLSALVETLLVGRRAGFLGLKKGGACLLELGGRPGSGRARLRWLLTASQLRRLGA